MAHFLFIEIADRDLNYLFGGIHQILYGRPPARATHLTIRGPYKHEIQSRTVGKYRDLLKDDPILIHGVGRFTNPNEEVVFLNVESPHLRSAWWKPDYTISEYGYNPHISLYRGSNVELAESLRRFFEHENLSLTCYEFRVVTHVTRQMTLFEPHIPTALLDTGRVRPGLLERLTTLMMRHRRLHSDVRSRESVNSSGPATDLGRFAATSSASSLQDLDGFAEPPRSTPSLPRR